MSSQSGYRFHESPIAEFTGIVEQGDLKRIEEFMRESIFHSSLDWQTKAQLENAALKAVQLIRFGSQQGYWEPLNSDK